MLKEKDFGCPNPFFVELSPEIVQLGDRLSREIANIQNSLQPIGLLESQASAFQARFDEARGNTGGLSPAVIQTLKTGGMIEKKGRDASRRPAQTSSTKS